MRLWEEPGFLDRSLGQQHQRMAQRDAADSGLMAIVAMTAGVKSDSYPILAK